MNSMTAFARREKTAENMTVSVEIKGCNSRFLEVFVHAPGYLRGFEKNVREQIAALCGRGRVDVYISVKEHNAAFAVTVNAQAAKAYRDAVDSLAQELGMDEKIGIAALLKMEGVMQTESKAAGEELYWKEIEPALKDALEDFCAERRREGEHTKADILKSLELIELSHKAVSSFAPVIEKSIKENVRARFYECVGDEVAENRVLAEIASLLLKYTIAEELSRLASHLGEFRVQAGGNARPGKMLDFLCQEINREVNTIGSKSSVYEVSSEVVTMKEALENIREQLKNVE
ncbi:MAG: YicC family protein [Spirochaetes bacterium]|nr:YicC family protein [Spirochaetota bacterium]